MTDQDLGSRLGEALERRVAGLDERPFTVDDVRGRAHRIRRGRRAVAGAVAAAVAAVALPAGMQLREPDTPPPEPVRPAPSPRPDGTFPLTLSDVPDGPPPQVPYVRHDDAVLVLPGREVPLPAPYMQVVPYDGGFLALSPEGPAVAGSTVRLLRLDADHREVEDLGPTAGPVVGNGSQVAWSELQGDGTSVLVTATTDGQEATSAAPGAALDPVGFLPGGTVVFRSTSRDGTTSFGTLSTEGRGEDATLTAFTTVADASAVSGIVVGRTDHRDDGTTCSGAVSSVADELLWERCGVTVGDLAPDGTLVVGHPGEALPGYAGLSVLDAATGEQVVELTAGDRAAQVQDAVWEDADSVLAVVTEGRRQAVVRIGLDGSLERVTPLTRPDGLEVDVFFAERPRGD